MVRKLSVLLFTLLSFGLAWGQKYVYRVTGGVTTQLLITIIGKTLKVAKELGTAFKS